MFLLDSWRAGRGWLAGRMGGWECRQGSSGFGNLSSVLIGNEMSLFLFTGAKEIRGMIESRLLDKRVPVPLAIYRRDTFQRKGVFAQSDEFAYFPGRLAYPHSQRKKRSEVHDPW